MRFVRYSKFKRCCDFSLSLVILPLLFPLLFITCLAILLQEGRPIFFKQLRPGLHGQPFYIFKLRTMNNRVDSFGNLCPDGQRITKLGSFLRSTSIDELPAIINVLNGSMSFIGPRPLLIEYLTLYSTEQARRHDVKPGFSGWAQIHGRNALSWEEKFRLDVWYVDHQNFWLDLRIFLITIWKVFRHDGISAVGEATMPTFTSISKNS